MIGFYLTLIDEPSDKEKFEVIYYKYKDMMYKIATSLIHNEALVDETVQDCLFKIAMEISKISDPSYTRTRALIVIMVRNAAINKLKAEHYDDVEVIEETEMISSDVLSEIISDLGFKDIVNEILNLESVYSDPLILRLLYEYSVEEVAEILGVPINTAKSRIYRGRKILKERLSKEYGNV